MPALTYPNEFTFYKIKSQDDLTTLQVTEELINLGQLVESLANQENFSEFRQQSIISFAEVIEKILQKGENESCVISTDATDYFGNSRPYETEFLVESFGAKERIVLSCEPFMLMSIYCGHTQINELLESLHELSRHPYFEEDGHNLKNAVALLQSSLIGNDIVDECAIAVVLRSYELHSA